jgi:hypothetical protein
MGSIFYAGILGGSELNLASLYRARSYIKYFRKHSNVSDFNILRRDTEVERIEGKHL